MKVFEIQPEPGYNPCVEDKVQGILSWLEEADDGDVFTIRVKEMSREEYAKFPEYVGP